MNMQQAIEIMNGWEPIEWDAGTVPVPCDGREDSADGPWRTDPCSERAEWEAPTWLASGEIGNVVACMWHAEHGTNETRPACDPREISRA